MRIEQSKGWIRSKSSDYLLYALIDSIVDYYFVLLEEVSEVMEMVEDKLLNNSSDGLLGQIHSLKKIMIHLNKSMGSTQELIRDLLKEEHPLIHSNTEKYLADVHDHARQIKDTLDTYFDMASHLLDLHLTSENHRMNEVMKFLTIIATLFIPLTFIVGVYGMNFKYMPELHYKWAYPIVWGVMILITVGSVRFFKSKKWL